MSAQRPLVKICGITRREDAELAVELGASAIGFVFWPESPRVIGTNQALAIGRSLPALVARVGVFVNQPPDEVAKLVTAAGLDAVQLHGDEQPGDYRNVGARLIKSVAPANAADAAAALALPDDVALLVDASDRTRRGGTGQLANWSLARDIAQQRPVMLAGGLSASNVADAVAAVGPWALDISSGVESAPGIKSADRLREFFAAVRSIA